MGYDQSILKGAKAAKKLHEDIGTRSRVEELGGRVDVFDAIYKSESDLIFRKLNGLLGAYLNIDDTPGIMITTQRRLPVQRFTGAHELGHFMLGHDTSVDKEESIEWSSRSLPFVEIEANAFAADFLSPRWLILFHCKRYGWKYKELIYPINVYQLSLRMGVSYSAVCQSLFFNKLIDYGTRENLLKVTPKEIKRSILPKLIEPENWYGDVWLLSERDKGLYLEGQPEDYFVFKEHENNGAGYLWDCSQLIARGFDVIREDRIPRGESENIGGGSIYELTLMLGGQPEGEMCLEHSRPWENESSIGEFRALVDVHGKEIQGISRVERNHKLSAG